MKIKHSGSAFNGLKVSQFQSAVFENRWIYSLIFLTYFDCTLKLTNQRDCIKVKENSFAYHDEILYSYFNVEDRFKAEHYYPSKKTERKTMAFTLALSLIGILVSLFLLLGVLALLFAVFFAFTVKHFSESLKFKSFGKNKHSVVRLSKGLEIKEATKYKVKYITFD